MAALVLCLSPRVGGPGTVLHTCTLPERWAQSLGLQLQVHSGGRLRTADVRQERLSSKHTGCVHRAKLQVVA